MKLSESQDLYGEQDDHDHPVTLVIMGDGKGEVVKSFQLPEDALQDLKHELGLKSLKVSSMDLDPDWVATFADTVAEAMGIEDKEAFRQRVLRDFGAVLTKSTDAPASPNGAEKEDEDGEAVVLHPSNLKHEVEVDEGGNAVHMDRTAKMVVRGVSQIFLDRETGQEVVEDDFDEYEDVEFDD